MISANRRKHKPGSGHLTATGIRSCDISRSCGGWWSVWPSLLRETA